MARKHRPLADAITAQDLAIRVLGFLAMDPNRIERFCALAGLEPVRIRDMVNERTFQLALLDHLLADESLLLVFCAHDNIPPEDIAPARRLLAADNA